jgi:hypothetical protein
MTGDTVSEGFNPNLTKQRGKGFPFETIRGPGTDREPTLTDDPASVDPLEWRSVPEREPL